MSYTPLRAYDLNEYLRIRGDKLYEHEEEHGYSHKCCCECIPGNCYHWTLGLISVGCILATFVCLGLFIPTVPFMNLSPQSHYFGDGSFAVAAMICFCSTFLLFESMQADPDNAEGHESCNLFHRARDGLSLWIGFFITFASLFYAAFRSDTMAILGKDPKFEVTDGDVEMDDTDNKVVSLLTAKDKQEAIAMDVKESNYDNHDDAVEDITESDDDGENEDKKANLYFHIVMMLATAYKSMLFTNLGTNKDSIDTTGTVSFIVGVCSSWTAFLLF